MTALWLEFLFCSAVIVYCGVKLSRYSDVIAEKSGLGRAWIGLVLMSGVTSLTELIRGSAPLPLPARPT